MSRYITEKVNGYKLVDEETGELLDYKQTRKLALDEFIMVFFSSYSKMYKLSGMQLKVLMCCWKKSTYNKENDKEANVFNNNAGFKEYCHANGLEVPNASIDNAISKLNKEGLLIKKCRGEYILNPKYFFKGTLSDRTKIIYNLVVEPNNNIQKD